MAPKAKKAKTDGGSGKKEDISLVFLTRDLRLADNFAISQAVALGGGEDGNDDGGAPKRRAALCFVLTPEQSDPALNPYHNSNCLQIIRNSLDDLVKRGAAVTVLRGGYADAVKKYAAKFAVRDVLISRDFTPFAAKREETVKRAAADAGAAFHLVEDNHILVPLDSVLNGEGKMYMNGMAYFKAFHARAKVPQPEPAADASRIVDHVFEPNFKWEDVYTANDSIHEPGGETRGQEILRKHAKDWKNYGKIENREMVDTTHLGSYVKFGCVSARAAFHRFQEAAPKNWELQIQILWREFYYNLYQHYDLDWKKEHKEKYRKFPWVGGEEKGRRLGAWLAGRTGFPLVDAGVRQLNATGFIHHRLRLVTCNFLSKIGRAHV